MDQYHSKKCFKCNETKDLGEFYKHSQMKDGHLNKCKKCTKKDVSENYYKNIDRAREYERERFQRPERKAKIAEYQRKRRKKNPEKYKANTAVCNAIRDGKLERKPCEVCGDPESQAHHEDYSKPFEVRWLCFVHHRQAHGQLAYI